MITLHTTVHISPSLSSSSSSSSSSTFSRPNLNHKVVRVRCALSPSRWRESRRLVSVSLFLSQLLVIPTNAMAAGLVDKYVKRKKLDPLESYVPSVLLAQFQIKDLKSTLEVDQPQYDTCRSLLRSGPASSLRVNIRAVAQYASDAGNGDTANNDVDQCLRALEDLDNLFLRASRKDRGATVETMKVKLGTALNALDSLLQTVPSDVLDKGKAMTDVYRNQTEESQSQALDPELKQLESLL